MSESIRINEIFFSIQGESLFVGKPTVFIRTSGCNLRCHWCDTKYSYYEGIQKTIDEILSETAKFGSEYVCVTGGEPLAQKPTIKLLEALLRANYIVSLETSGSFSIVEVPKGIVKVIDIKCPDSGESDKMAWENLLLVSKDDQFKFVIASRKDFEWARHICRRNDLEKRCTVLFSPAHGLVSPRDLAAWILEEKAPVTMQVQLHKEIWGPDERGV